MYQYTDAPPPFLAPGCRLSCNETMKHHSWIINTSPTHMCTHTYVQATVAGICPDGWYYSKDQNCVHCPEGLRSVAVNNRSHCRDSKIYLNDTGVIGTWGFTELDSGSGTFTLLNCPPGLVFICVYVCVCVKYVHIISRVYAYMSVVGYVRA